MRAAGPRQAGENRVRPGMCEGPSRPGPTRVQWLTPTHLQERAAAPRPPPTHVQPTAAGPVCPSFPVDPVLPRKDLEKQGSLTYKVTLGATETLWAPLASVTLKMRRGDKDRVINSRR